MNLVQLKAITLVMSIKNLNLFKNIHLNLKNEDSNYHVWIRPPFCPNPDCCHHFEGVGNWYVKKGRKKTKKFPFENSIFKCKNCGKHFSSNTFSIDYRKQLIAYGPVIMDAISNGETVRSVAKKLEVYENTIRSRIKDLSKQAQIFENRATKNLIIEEPIAYDGFETFSYSQFDPCYINTAVGSDSHYTYATTFSPLNRKGRMTKWQKKKVKLIEKTHGRYPKDSVRKESEYIFEKLHKKAKKLVLYTDEHKSYQAALSNLKLDGVEHLKINSKERRDPSNILFAVNHLHLTMRHFNSSQRRETIAFAKNEAALMDRVHLIRIHKNFMRSKFEKKTDYDQKSNIESPAMKVRIAKKILTFDEVFQMRRPMSHAKFDEKEKESYLRIFNFARRKIA